MALVLSLSATLALPTSASAESENSLFSQLTRKKKGTRATPAATTGHTQGSGIPATTETAILNDGSAAPFITPDSAAGIQALADRYAKIVADGGWPVVPRGRTKKGSSGKPVAILNQRLYVEGYLRVEATQGEYAGIFTSATEDALKRFQSNHGLSPTGIMDGVTLEALNVSAAARLATIRANIPRLAEYSKNLGSRYVVVNVPAQQIETVNDGKVYSIHNAIVGRPSRPTPVVMTPLTIVRFNPYWNAPASIVARDIVPRMLSRGPSKVMADMNMKVFKGVGGPEIDPNTVDWRRAKIDDYHFRQEPGGDNAMATAKVEFNSPFGIYLHDTPEPQLFSTSNRFYSSGCVRVQKVAILINWILQGQDGINEARIAELAETKERLDVNIANAPQLRVAYLTAWPAKDGVAAFRSDIYNMDGSGFVVGQPLPVGEKMDGQRFVLKPIPYLQDDIDTDNGGIFASLFGGKSSENDVARPGQTKSQADALIKLGGTSAKGKPVNAKTTASKAPAKKPGTAVAKRKWQGSGKNELASDNTTGTTTVIPPKGKKPVQKKPATKTTTAAKKDAGKTVKVAKADPKAAAGAKAKPVAAAKPATTTKPAAATASTAAKPAAPAKAQAPAAKPASCKAGSDGKMPAGCPAPTTAAAKATPTADKAVNAAN
ncbi:L,D-transpeptidase family protein [Aestuariivirga sp.]|uniref:L,D-transpeptidase family protein n=1 Tax=Aestuariivirga sp. TaxID=2650926 RepID=UPI003BACA81F